LLVLIGSLYESYDLVAFNSTLRSRSNWHHHHHHNANTFALSTFHFFLFLSFFVGFVCFVFLCVLSVPFSLVLTVFVLCFINSFFCLFWRMSLKDDAHAGSQLSRYKLLTFYAVLFIPNQWMFHRFSGCLIVPVQKYVAVNTPPG
jgi:hypothetical protein